MDNFNLEVRGERGRHRITLSGELDMATAPAVEAAIAELCTDGALEIDVDLRGLGFIDSTGIRIILVGKEICEANNCDFYLIRSRQLHHPEIWEITGLDALLPWRETAQAPA